MQTQKVCVEEVMNVVVKFVDMSLKKILILSFTEPGLSFFSLICYFGSLSLKNRNKREKEVKLCCDVTFTTLDNFQHSYEVRVISKVQAIVLVVSPNVALRNTDCPFLLALVSCTKYNTGYHH